MTPCSVMTTPASPDTIEPAEPASSLVVDDPSVVLALFTDVDDILCAAVAAHCRRPAPPVTGCALREPRCAGRSSAHRSPRRWDAPVHRLAPMQRSPPATTAPPATTPSHSQ